MLLRDEFEIPVVELEGSVKGGCHQPALCTEIESQDVRLIIAIFPEERATDRRVLAFKRGDAKTAVAPETGGEPTTVFREPQAHDGLRHAGYPLDEPAALTIKEKNIVAFIGAAEISPAGNGISVR
jgi:hypothetical protein